MKKILFVLLAMMLITTMLFPSLAESNSGAPNDNAPAKYEIKDAAYDKNEMLVSGTVEHDASTDTVKRLFARVTFFMANGTFTVVSTVIDDDGTFQAMCSGDVIHIAIQATNSAKVKPGQYNAYGGREFDVE